MVTVGTMLDGNPDNNFFDKEKSSASIRTANSPARCTRSWRERIFML